MKPVGTDITDDAPWIRVFVFGSFTRASTPSACACVLTITIARTAANRLTAGLLGCEGSIDDADRRLVKPLADWSVVRGEPAIDLGETDRIDAGGREGFARLQGMLATAGSLAQRPQRLRH